MGRDGRLLLGPDGSALRLGADKAKLLTASGRPLLSPSGAALGLSPAGDHEWSNDKICFGQQSVKWQSTVGQTRFLVYWVNVCVAAEHCL